MSFFRSIALISALIMVSAPASARLELDDASIRQWADDVFGRALADHRFTGLGFVAVQDGRIVSTLTYGYEKWAGKIPIDPARTQFRIGSDSKTFTGTAVAQLYDRGLIESLDDPANKYLERVELPNWNGQEISIWNLLTHRAGFEEMGKGIASDEDVAVPVSGEIAQWLMPELVRPPGSRSVYCNYCTSLLGALVEDVTGETLHDFLSTNVFRPLDMRNTILGYDHQPTPDVGIAEIFYPNGETEPLKHVGIHPFIAPAGNIYAPLNDMAAYMLAHLDAGRSGAKALMSAETFRTMHSFKTRNHPAVSGFGMKFMVHDWNGERVVEHGGGWPGYFTSMTLFPDSNAGIFVSVFAGSPPMDLWAMLANQLGFSNRLTPADGVTIEPVLNTFKLHDMVLSRFLGDFTYGGAAAGDAELPPLAQFVGRYRGERRNHTSAARLGDMVGGSSTRVSLHEEGGLMIDGRGPYQQVAPDVFWLPDSLGGEYAPTPLNYLYAFMRDENGEITHLTGEVSINPAEPISAYQAPEVAMEVVLIALLLSITGLAAIFWHNRGRGSARLNFAVAGLGVCSIAIIIAVMDVLGPGRGYSPMPDIALGRTGELLLLLVFTNLFAVLALLALYQAAQTWMSRGWGSGAASWVYRLQLTLVSLAAVIAIPFLWLHGGIGFNLP